MTQTRPLSVSPRCHCSVSTGVFPGKILTRGGRTWYKEGVAAPVVKRFALQPGHEEAAEPLVTSLRRCRDALGWDAMRCLEVRRGRLGGEGKKAVVCGFRQCGYRLAARGSRGGKK